MRQDDLDALTSAQALVRFLGVFSVSDETEIRRYSVEALAESFDAPVVGIVCEGKVIASVGLGDNPDDLVRLAGRGLGQTVTKLSQLGKCSVLTLPVPGMDDTVVTLARPSGPFDGEEIVVVRTMIRVMRLARITADSLAEQVRANAEVRSLAEKFKERHVSLTRRVLNLQRAVSQPEHNESPLTTIIQQATEAFPTDQVFVRLLEGPDAGVWNAEGETPMGSWSGTDEAELVERTIREEQLATDPGGSDRSAVGSAMSAPIYQRGEAVGATVVIAGRQRREDFSDEDKEALIILAGYVSVAVTDRANTRELEESLTAAEWRATHDDLTGLPNRPRLLQLLNHQLRDTGSAVVFYIDLDGFKTINDLYGHAAGDRALQEVGTRLATHIRREESVGRIAGDEFVAVLPRIDHNDALRLARRLAAQLNKPMEIDGRWLVLPASIGIASLSDSTAEELLEAADVALYRAKASSGERIAFFDNAAREHRQRRVAIEQQLRLATAGMDQFHLVYQPVVHLEDRRAMGLEALIRWENPTLGAVPPDEFIAIAEETDVITQIDDWALRTALTETSERGLRAPMRVSVNLSPQSFLLPNLVQMVQAALRAADMSPDRLAVEITERVILGDPAVVGDNVAALQDLGVEIVLDDFGTGYSSLSYLRDLRIDGLKIDRSFVEGAEDNPRGEAILRAVLEMARDLDIDAIAEGVERSEQVEVLSSHGCECFQGFYFGRPARLEDLEVSVVLSA